VGGAAIVTVTIDPLRRTLLDDVRLEAERVVAEADSRAADKVAGAKERAAELIERARTEGEAIAAFAGAREQAAARRRARSLVLAVQRELFDDFCRDAREAVHRLRADRRYPALLERLSAAARAQLGEDCRLEIDPADAGGVLGSNGTRRVDYTLDALVDRCIERLGSEVKQLWA
jgi:vacuolar-type H+-ATPase subunit E/Vma4